MQSVAPSAVSNQPWMLVAGGMALLAGGLLIWSGDLWPGVAVHQAGYALVFVILLEDTVSWPLVGLTLALGALAIWWDINQETKAVARPKPVDRLVQRMGNWWAEARSKAITHFPRLAQWRDSWLSRHGTALLLAVALASLAGAPLTVGARGRWPLYAALLQKGDAFLFVVLAADTFLAAGLWTVLGTTVGQAGDRRRGLWGDSHDHGAGIRGRSPRYRQAGGPQVLLPTRRQ